MSGKNQRVRRSAVGFLVLLVLAVSAQATVLQRAAPVAVELLDRMLPASLRAWLAVPLPLKCGIAIDPNGGPCPAASHPASRHPAPRRPLPLKCGGTIDPNGGPCPAVQPHPACAGCG
jgi:hypothetical protein